MPDYIQIPRHGAVEEGTEHYPEATSMSSTLGLAGMFVTLGTNGKISLATAAGGNVSSATTVKIIGQACRPFAAAVDTTIPIIPTRNGKKFQMSLCSNGTGTAYVTSYAFDAQASNFCALRNLSGVFVVNVASTATNEHVRIHGPVPGTEADAVPMVFASINPLNTGWGA